MSPSNTLHEALFRLALEEAPIGIAVVATDGRFVQVNRALCEIVGYTSDELTKLTFQAITHPEDVDTDVALADQMFRGDIPRYQLAKRYVRKDGSTVHVLLHASVARGPDGAPLYAIAHVEDITERVLAENRLRQVQERHELALRGADQVVWDWNLLTGEVVLDARWAEMRGYRPDELRPHVDSWIESIHPDDLAHVRRALSDCFEGRKPDYDCEHRVATKTGGWLWVLARGKVFARDAGGRPLRMLGTALDITERKRLEQSLRDAAGELEHAQAVAKTGSWRIDVDRDVVAWSNETYRMFGVPLGTPVSFERFLACVHPDDRAHVERSWTAAQRGGAYELEHRVLVDGEVRWVHSRAEIELDAYGRFVRALGVTQDVTERKQAEAALRLAEARASGIVSVSLDAIIAADDERRITLFNAAAEAIFGYTAAEVLGRDFDLLVPERLRFRHRADVTAFAAAPEVARRMGDRGHELVGLRKTGEEFPADAAISKVAVGGRWVFTVTLRDVTEQRRREREQRFLAEAGATLAGSLDYGDTLRRVAELAVEDLADVCIVDIVGENGEVRRIEVASRDPQLASTCEQLAGRPNGLRRSLSPRTLASRRPALEQDVTDWLATLELDDEHASLLRAIAPQSMLSVPLLAYDKLIGVLVLVSTTASRRYGPADVRFAEELARHAALSIENARLYALARRAVQARDDVLGIVAHDLRNPLNTIGLQTQLLRMQGLEGEARRSAESIERASLRMGRLIADLLDVSRVEAGSLFVEPARVPPAEVVRDAIESHRALAQRSEISLATDIAPDLPDVWADRGRMLQVLDNLVGNAVKFTGRGGHIVVAAVPRGDAVELSVHDSGVGLSEDAARHVFDRFWQARRVDRRGAGLGLAIAKGIVEAHRGRIWVESTPGLGTTFRFTIPVAPRLEPEAVGAATG